MIGARRSVLAVPLVRSFFLRCYRVVYHHGSALITATDAERTAAEATTTHTNANPWDATATTATAAVRTGHARASRDAQLVAIRRAVPQ